MFNNTQVSWSRSLQIPFNMVESLSANFDSATGDANSTQTFNRHVVGPDSKGRSQASKKLDRILGAPTRGVDFKDSVS